MRIESSALEIPEYNIEQETIENILPKYESANVKFKTKDPITENIDDLKVIKDAIYTNTSILERIKDKYIVTDGKNWYRPEEMYLRSNDTRSGYALVNLFKELIEQGDRKQRESEKDDMELEISPISEKGKLKREKNLDRQLADSMDNFISVARGLSFSSRPSNKEERIFLEQEYDGHCQIF